MAKLECGDGGLQMHHLLIASVSAHVNWRRAFVELAGIVAFADFFVDVLILVSRLKNCLDIRVA